MSRRERITVRTMSSQRRIDSDGVGIECLVSDSIDDIDCTYLE